MADSASSPLVITISVTIDQEERWAGVGLGGRELAPRARGPGFHSALQKKEEEEEEAGLRLRTNSCVTTTKAAHSVSFSQVPSLQSHPDIE